MVTLEGALRPLPLSNVIRVCRCRIQDQVAVAVAVAVAMAMVQAVAVAAAMANQPPWQNLSGASEVHLRSGASLWRFGRTLDASCAVVHVSAKVPH